MKKLLFLFSIVLYLNDTKAQDLIKNERDISLINNAYKNSTAYQNSLFQISNLKYKFYISKMTMGPSPVDVFYYLSQNNYGKFCYWSVCGKLGDNIDIRVANNVFFKYQDLDKICE